MAEDFDNDDQWLYGDQPDVPSKETKEPEPVTTEESPTLSEDNADTTPQITEKPDEKNEENEESESKTTQPNIDEKEEDENIQDNQDDDKDHTGDDEDLDDDDDSDDDVNVVIGDIKTTTPYTTSLNIKRGNLLSSSTQIDKSKSQQSGKFNVEEFEQIGTINGVPATEFNLDSLEDKPWRKPGADITDYFNYGFNEDTWKAYCERQKRMRVNESGVGLAAQINPLARSTVPILNDNSKYSGNFLGVRKAGPPPGRRMTGAIDVIGGTSKRIAPTTVVKNEPAKMNVIQVMTADRREYSRKPGMFPDMSIPPPNSFDEFQPEYNFNMEPEPFYGNYEPTQDSQWGTNGDSTNWVPTPTEVKTINPTPGPLPIPGPVTVPGPGPGPGLGPGPGPGPGTGPGTGPTPPPVGPPPPVGMHMVPPVPMRISPQRVKESPRRSHSKERDHSREVSRGRSERPRERERSHRRERSRSRSRRHKSRSRSPPFHRSHRKKKSRRHEDSE